MGKSKKRMVSTIITMAVVAVIILLLYFYLAFRMNLKETSVKDLSEVETLLDKDLELYYPETPREVVKLYSNMMKTLYTDLKDDEVKALALRIRELYDPEFLGTKTEEDYLKDLYSEIAQWKEANRKISYYLLVNEELEKESVISGKEYAVVYVSYTIQEKGKYSETWKFLLRLSEDDKWKILGWEYAPAEDPQ